MKVQKIALLFVVSIVFTSLKCWAEQIGPRIHCGDCKKVIKKADPTKVIPAALKAAVHVIKGTGDWMAKGVHQGGQAAGDALKATGSASMDVGKFVVTGPGAVVYDLMKVTGDGINAVAHGVDHFAHEYDKHVWKKEAQAFKDALPYIARAAACEATLCLSEKRLHDERKEARAKARRDLQQYEAEKSKIGAAEREKHVLSYLKERKLFEQDLIEEKDLLVYQIGQLNMMMVSAHAELNSRKKLALLDEATPSIANAFETDPAFGRLVVNTTPAEDSMSNDQVNYLADVMEYGKASSLDVLDVFNRIMAYLPPYALKDIAALSEGGIPKQTEQLGNMVILINGAKEEIKYLENELAEVRKAGPKK